MSRSDPRQSGIVSARVRDAVVWTLKVGRGLRFDRSCLSSPLPAELFLFFLHNTCRSSAIFLARSNKKGHNHRCHTTKQKSHQGGHKDRVHEHPSLKGIQDKDQQRRNKHTPECNVY